jgi:phosphatidate cytidylyltransferase
MRRLLTAAALIPVIVYVVLFSNPWVFLGVVAAVAFLCYREYDTIAASYGFGAPGPLGYAIGAAVLVSRAQPWSWLSIVLAALIASVLAMRARDLAHALPRAALLLLGVVYIFGCWKCAIELHAVSPHLLMYALIVNWAGDAGAYYVGKRFGRHKMAPRVSPNKSWEGAAASVAASILVAVPYLWYFVHIGGSAPIPLFILLTAAANAAGQIGDLAESAMKRGAGVKDSGALLPGHGGLLDRVDSTLFALPVICAFVALMAVSIGGH